MTRDLGVAVEVDPIPRVPIVAMTALSMAPYWLEGEPQRSNTAK